MAKLKEYDLVVKFRDARARLQSLKDEAKAAQKEFDEIERKLIEKLNDEGKDATARFEGLGYVGVHKPSIFASYAPDNKDALFSYLRKKKRQDLIQEVVNARSLSTYVKELLDNNQEVPDCISYYMKQTARFYADKQGG